MAKITGTVANKTNVTTDRSSIKRYALLDQNNNVVATLINRSLADKWVKDRQRGAVKVIENNR